MNEVKFKANKKDLEAIGEQIQEATAALDTADATAGQVLKVETPGEAPVWGEDGVGMKVFEVFSESIPQDITSSFTITSGDIPEYLTLDAITDCIDNGIIPVILLHRVSPSTHQPIKQYHPFILQDHRAVGGEIFSMIPTFTSYTNYVSVTSVTLTFVHSSGNITMLSITATTKKLSVYTS